MEFLFFIFSILFSVTVAQKTCVQKTYRGPDNAINCVCNATYCDEFPPLGTLSSGQAAVYTSSQSGKRFERVTQNFVSGAPNPITITPDETQKNQTIIGFGGAFTDASGLNIATLSAGSQQNLLNSYFGPSGIGYTVGRVPIASCDFSTRNYSYDDVDGDMNLTNFALVSEDFNYKIPYIKTAMTLTNNKLKLYGSPWSAPAWMKTNGEMEHGGNLKGEVNGPYYQTWANYFVRFFEEYAKNGVNFWGVTMQNEPGAAFSWQTMKLSSSMERDFAKGAWGQALRANPVTKNLKLMVCDDQRGSVMDFTNTVFGDPDAYAIVDGLAVHWYGDPGTNPDITSQAHAKLGNKFILYTEACNGDNHIGPKHGDWGNGDTYMQRITANLQNWVTGWVDWNMVLNFQGGPNWVGNLVDSPILVTNETDEFEKQPMYYALGHLAKFIVPDSTMIGVKTSGFSANTNLDVIAALTPTNQKVVVINNKDVAATYQISVTNKQGATLNLSLEPRSWTTIVYSD